MNPEKQIILLINNDPVFHTILGLVVLLNNKLLLSTRLLISKVTLKVELEFAIET